MRGRRPVSPSWPQFAAWALCGASGLLLIAGAFTPLALVGPVGGLLFAGVALLLGGSNVSAVGAAAGPGVCVSVVAVVHDAWPATLAGLLLIIGPGVLFAHVRRPRSVVGS